MKKPLDRAGLERVLRLLGVAPAELVRKDKRFTELGLNPDDYRTVEQVSTSPGSGNRQFRLSCRMCG